jgi:hypothetical protein
LHLTKAKALEPVSHFIGSMIETRCLFKLWSNECKPHHGAEVVEPLFAVVQARAVRGVALQVAFERQILKPVFHLIGYRLWVWKVIGYG